LPPEGGALSSSSLPVTASSSQALPDTQPNAYGSGMSLSVTSTHSGIVSSASLAASTVFPSSFPVPSSSAANVATAMQGLSLSPELAHPDDFDQAVQMLASASKDLDGVSSSRVSPLSSHSSSSSSLASRPPSTVVHAFVSPSSSVVSSLPLCMFGVRRIMAAIPPPAELRATADGRHACYGNTNAPRHANHGGVSITVTPTKSGE